VPARGALLAAAVALGGGCQHTTVIGGLGACASDSDCDAASYCDRAAGCTALGAGGAIACAGGTALRDACDPQRTPSGWQACVGAPGPADCPYCTDGSCFRPGLCGGDGDCHQGDACSGGLCRPAAPECPVMAMSADVVAGSFAAGHEVCVRDTVTSIETGYTMVMHLGGAGLTAVLTQLYLGGGLTVPSVGATVTLHGVVRWDQWRTHWEIDPVDWWQP
jgi:hypothetical protein